MDARWLKALDVAVVAFMAMWGATIVLLDGQAVAPKIYPSVLVEMKNSYVAAFDDYITAKPPPFFIALVATQIMLLPLIIANIYGVINGKKWASTGCLVVGVATVPFTTALIGELIGSKRGSPKLIRLFYPFIMLQYCAIIRGLLPHYNRSSASEYNGLHASKKAA